MAGNYKSPPEMRDGLSYSDWKKELDIWCAFTDLDKKRQGGALFLTLSGKACETVLAEVELADINKETGVAAVTKALDTLFVKDAAESALIRELHQVPTTWWYVNQGLSYRIQPSPEQNQNP